MTLLDEASAHYFRLVLLCCECASDDLERAVPVRRGAAVLVRLADAVVLVSVSALVRKPTTSKLRRRRCVLVVMIAFGFAAGADQVVRRNCATCVCRCT